MISIISNALLSFTDFYLKEKIDKSAPSFFPKKLAKGRIQICQTHNYGLCLNHLDKYPKLSKQLTAACLIGFFCFFFPKYQRQNSIFLKIGFLSTLFGGLNNLYDRIKRGYVMDYLQFPKFKYLGHIIYNLSDFQIFFGLFCILLDSLCPKE